MLALRLASHFLLKPTLRRHAKTNRWNSDRCAITATAQTPNSAGRGSPRNRLDRAVSCRRRDSTHPRCGQVLTSKQRSHGWPGPDSGSHCVSATASGFPVHMSSIDFSKLSNSTWIAVGRRACSIERWPTGRFAIEDPLARHGEKILEASPLGCPWLRLPHLHAPRRRAASRRSAS